MLISCSVYISCHQLAGLLCVVLYDMLFAILCLRLKRKTHPAFRVLNAFYFQTDFNLRFKRKRDVRLTCERV